MTKDEALKLALEFAEEHSRHWTGFGRSGRDVVAAIKEALSNPEQEPMAWLWELTGEVTTDPNRADGMWLPLYTSPPQRKPLTDEEIDLRLCPTNNEHEHDDRFWDGVEWAKKQLKEKNT